MGVVPITDTEFWEGVSVAQPSDIAPCRVLMDVSLSASGAVFFPNL